MGHIGGFMKWSVQQLQKLTSSPLIFDEKIDFSELSKNVSDMISIDPAHVFGVVTNLGNEKFRVRYHIDVQITLECALTLEPVDYHFEKDYDEVFAVDASDDEYLIEKNTLDLTIAVWSNILIDKPIVVTREDAYEILKERGIVLNETFDDNED